MKVFLVFLGMALGASVLIIVSSLLNGLALSILWGWFISGWLGVPELPVLNAVGIMLFVSLLQEYKGNSDNGKDRSGTEAIIIVSAVLVRPLIAIGMGYIIMLFI